MSMRQEAPESVLSIKYLITSDKDKELEIRTSKRQFSNQILTEAIMGG